MAKAGDKKDIKTDILLATLPDVPFDGWSNALLLRAAKRLRMKPEAVHKAFPAGVDDLLPYFSDWADAEMQKHLTPKKLKDLRVRDKIALGVRERLEVLGPFKQAVSAALAFQALPPRSLRLPQQLWRSADRIWWAAGDTATDYNHYTKRILLSGVLASTTLFWLNDVSAGHKDTWAFLDRRIDNVLAFGRKISGFRKKAGQA